MSRPYEELRFRGTPEEVEAQWLEARKKGIGGSDAAAVLGMSKYSTPITVWQEKTGMVDPPDLSGNESVHWGKVLEDVVAREFAERHPEMRVRRANAMLWSKERPWMFASVDRLLTDERGRKGVLEIKTCDARLAEDWADGVPDYYLPQPTHYLAVTGFEFFAVAALVGGNRYVEYFHERDEEDVEALVRCESEFWENCVLGGSMPPATSSRADSAALRGMFPDPSEEYVEMLPEDVPEIGALQEAAAMCKELEARKRELANAVKRKIGDAKGIKAGDKKVTWCRSDKRDGGLRTTTVKG